MAANRDNQTASLEKVRDILFGEQARNQEKQIAHFERRLRRELQDGATGLSKQLQALEQGVDKELAALNERIEAEENDAAAFQEEIGARLDQVAKSLEQKLGALGQQVSKDLGQLRQELTKSMKALRDESAAQRAELEDELLAELEDVRAAHIDRSQLAALLADLAVRVGGKKTKG